MILITHGLWRPIAEFQTIHTGGPYAVGRPFRPPQSSEFFPGNMGIGDLSFFLPDCQFLTRIRIRSLRYCLSVADVILREDETGKYAISNLLFFFLLSLSWLLPPVVVIAASGVSQSQLKRTGKKKVNKQAGPRGLKSNTQVQNHVLVQKSKRAPDIPGHFTRSIEHLPHVGAAGLLGVRQHEAMGPLCVYRHDIPRGFVM